MSQQAYMFKVNGEYVISHNGGKNYHVYSFKDIPDVAEYLSKFAAGGPVQVETGLPPHFNPKGAKVDSPTFWEIQLLKDMLDAPENFDNSEEKRADEEESKDFLSRIGNPLPALMSILRVK